MNYRYHEIAAALQQQVRQLQPGDFLESEQLLAQKYAVSHMTMRQALNVLVEEGWLRRQRGKGSVVVDRLSTGEFAIVASPEMLAADASPFYRMTISALIEELRAVNPRYRASIHLGQAGVPDEDGFAATVDLLDPRIAASMRGVFTFKPLYAVAETLEAQGVPVVRLGCGAEEWSVWYDATDLVCRGVAHLAACGCRRPALIWGSSARPSRHEEAFDTLFAETAQKHGLEVRPEWLSHIEAYNWTEQNGYDLFAAIWSQAKRPDGLLVTDDMLCRGSLRAITRLGVQVPEQLRLVTHANAGVSLPFHLTVTRLESSPADFARQACDLMLRRARGQAPAKKRVVIPTRLVPGET